MPERPVRNAADLVVVCRDEARNVATLGGDARVGLVTGRAAAGTALDAAVSLAGRAGATVAAALLVDGDPAAALLSTARERSADLLVVGSLRDTGIAERLLGTVATEVVRRADCEVLIVRPRVRTSRAGSGRCGRSSAARS